MIVVDTNVIASLWVPNDMDELAYSVLKKDPEWVAPVLWFSEFRNILALYLRREVLDLASILQAMQEAEQLMHTRAWEVNSVQVLSLVSRSGCSSYDCEFVALAKDLGVQMVTFDRKICREFPEIAVHPDDFLVV
ncbi:MAG: PIN domain-containing protein [Balneolaceae bacterium]|jgi:predicted nucleic acid-binding protein|nr:MAG: PIN domain-containing protein [Balneolaceae bacterium]